MSSDAGLFLRVLPPNAEPFPHPGPDLMFHIYQVPFADNTEREGYPRPDHAICMTPNVSTSCPSAVEPFRAGPISRLYITFPLHSDVPQITRSRSRGKLSLASSNPSDKPLLDFRYFSDPDAYDARILVEGIKWARRVAQQSPFKEHLIREVAPGPACQTDEDISSYARKVAHTVYHPAGTCKMGTPSKDEMAVVDEKDLRVVGLRGVRICDASVMPTLPTVSAMAHASPSSSFPSLRALISKTDASPPVLLRSLL